MIKYKVFRSYAGLIPSDQKMKFLLKQVSFLDILLHEWVCLFLLSLSARTGTFAKRFGVCSVEFSGNSLHLYMYKYIYIYIYMYIYTNLYTYVCGT